MKTLKISTASHDLFKAHVGQQIKNFGLDGKDYIVTAKRPHGLDMHIVKPKNGVRNGQREIGKSYLKIEFGIKSYMIHSRKSFGMGLFKTSLDNHGETN